MSIKKFLRSKITSFIPKIALDSENWGYNLYRNTITDTIEVEYYEELETKVLSSLPFTCIENAIQHIIKASNDSVIDVNHIPSLV